MLLFHHQGISRSTKVKVDEKPIGKLVEMTQQL